MDDQLNGRQICVWRGKDPFEDLNSLADAVAATGELFDHGGVVVWLSPEGQLVPAGGPVLQEIIGRRLVIVQVVNRDGRWVREYVPFVASGAMLRTLLNAESKKEGSLILRLPPTTLPVATREYLRNARL
jgi:hypothetical protein